MLVKKRREWDDDTAWTGLRTRGSLVCPTCLDYAPLRPTCWSTCEISQNEDGIAIRLGLSVFSLSVPFPLSSLLLTGLYTHHGERHVRISCSFGRSHIPLVVVWSKNGVVGF